MLKVNYYVGLNDKDLHTQIISRDNAHALVSEVLAEHGHRGATLYDASGLWNGESENTIVVELLLHGYQANNLEALKKIANEFRRVFHQDAVIMTMTELKALEFIC